VLKRCPSREQLLPDHVGFFGNQYKEIRGSRQYER
jgi:hypothetical protein